MSRQGAAIVEVVSEEMEATGLLFSLPGWWACRGHQDPLGKPILRQGRPGTVLLARHPEQGGPSVEADRVLVR